MTRRRCAALLLLGGAALASAAPVRGWAVHYDGPDHQEDKVTGLVVDSAGNAYLTGYSFGRETDYQFATVKVSAAGETLWTRRDGSPFNSEDRTWTSCLDLDGSLIVAGGTIADSGSGWDFQLIRYAPDGKPLWLRRLDFPEHGDDKPASVAVGPDNSIYVCGSARPRPRVADRSDWDIAVVKLSAAGETLWTRLHDAAGRDDLGVALAVDGAGDCYVTGKTTNQSGSTDIVVLRFGGDGRLVWQQTIDGAGRATDFPTGLLLGPDRCFVCGAGTGKGTGFDYLLAGFDRDGNPLWQRTFDAAGRVDIAQAACFDSSGNVILTGQSTGSGSSFDVATVAYSPVGEHLWTSRYNGPRNGADRGWCVASSGRAVLVGGSSDGEMGYPDGLLLALAESGDTLWTFRHFGGGLGETRFVSIAPLPDRILAAGSSNRPGTGFDYLLLCLKEPDDGSR